jgi:hypothetical protein
MSAIDWCVGALVAVVSGVGGLWLLGGLVVLNRRYPRLHLLAVVVSLWTLVGLAMTAEVVRRVSV